MSDWFGGFLETVRQKSEDLIAMYKEDLQEFTSTISEDTKKVIETQVTAAAAANAIGGLEKIINQIAGGGTEDEKEKMFFPPPDSSLYSKEPEDMEDYNSWSATFDIKTKTEEISELLASDEHMRNLHREMVPAIVSYGEFWQRYFYHYNKLKEKEDRRAALLQRANAAIASKETTDDLWDIDEFENDDTTSEKAAESLAITSAEVIPAIPSETLATPSPTEQERDSLQGSTRPASEPTSEQTPPSSSFEESGIATPLTAPAPAPAPAPVAVTASPTEEPIVSSTRIGEGKSSGNPGEGEDWADWE